MPSRNKRSPRKASQPKWLAIAQHSRWLIGHWCVPRCPKGVYCYCADDDDARSGAVIFAHILTDAAGEAASPTRPDGTTLH